MYHHDSPVVAAHPCGHPPAHPCGHPPAHLCGHPPAEHFGLHLTRITRRQWRALVLAAGFSPVFQICAGVAWPLVLAGGLAAALLTGAAASLLRRLRLTGADGSCLQAPADHGLWGPADRGLWDPADPADPPAARLLGALLALTAAVPLLWLALRTGVQSSRAFPETAGRPAAAALLVALAAYAAFRGPGVPGRCAGVLLWITVGLYGTVLLGSLPQLRLSDLRLSAVREAGGPDDVLRCAAALSVPIAGLFLIPREAPKHEAAIPVGTASVPDGGGRCASGEEDRRELPVRNIQAAALETLPVSAALLAAALAASLVTAATMTPALAAEPMSFLTLARSVSILGVMQRFEALVSAAMLLSDFCLCALLLAAAAVLLRRWSGRLRRDPALCLAALPVFSLLRLPDRACLALLTAICCGLRAASLPGIVPRRPGGKNAKKI